MTTGLSGTFAFNGIDFSLPPTSGRYLPRQEFGVDGNAHSIYPAFREFELTWELIGQNDLSTFISAYNAIGNTGTVVVDIPGFGLNAYSFVRVSGCVLTEPELDIYFQGYSQSVRLVIRKIPVT